MKNNFTEKFRFFLLAFCLVGSMNLFAQPANDGCGGAIDLVLAADEASCVQVAGDTRMTEDATMVTTTPSVCSGSWYTDDVWYTVTTGATVPANGIMIRAAFGDMADDVPNVGMAVYYDCEATSNPLACFSDAPGRDSIEIRDICDGLEANHTYYVRVWSAGGPTVNAGTFRICAYENPNELIINSDIDPSQVIFEETFDDGLAGWESNMATDSGEVWRWYDNGLLPTAFGSVVGINNPLSTCSPGAIGFPGGWYQTGMTGDVANIPATYKDFTGEVTSPSIDLSAVTVGVSVKLDQAARRLNANSPAIPFYAVSTSIDGGSNWGPYLPINIDQVANGDALDNTIRVPLPGIEGNSDVKIRFSYQGDFYYWMIDRVQIIEREANNMRANAFYAIAPNFITPASQTDTMRFLIDIENVGDKDQTNVNVNMNIVNSAGAEVYDTNLDYGTVPSLFLDENRPFPTFFIPPAVEDTYTATYTVSSDSTDFDISDNTQQFQFIIGDSVFAKDDPSLPIDYANWTALDGAAEYTMATTYFVKDGADPVDPTIRYECSSILVNVDRTADNVGGVLNVLLYKWVDVNGDGLAQADERNGVAAGGIVASADYTIVGGESDILLQLENFDDPDLPVYLEDQTTYVLATGVNSPTPATYIRIGYTDLNYAATDLAYDSLGLRRVSSLWNTSSGNAGIDNELSRLNNIDFRMRMHISDVIIEATNDPLDEANLVKVYPSPASEVINLELDLVENMDKAAIMIIDMNGRTVLDQRYDNLTSQTLTFSVADFPAGTYFLKLQSDKGYSTKKFTVTK